MLLAGIAVGIGVVSLLGAAVVDEPAGLPPTDDGLAVPFTTSDILFSKMSPVVVLFCKFTSKHANVLQNHTAMNVNVNSKQEIRTHANSMMSLTVEPGSGGKEVASKSNLGDSREGLVSLADT